MSWVIFHFLRKHVFFIIYLSTVSSGKPCICKQRQLFVFKWFCFRIWALALALLSIYLKLKHFYTYIFQHRMQKQNWHEFSDSEFFFLAHCLSSSDCNYTCHYRCQSLIQLDCSTDGKLSMEQRDLLDDSIETDTNVVRSNSLFTQSVHEYIFVLLVWRPIKKGDFAAVCGNIT